MSTRSGPLRLLAPVLLAAGVAACGSRDGRSYALLDLSNVPAEVDEAVPADFLGPGYARISIDLDYDTDAPPEPEVLDAFTSYLGARVQPKDVVIAVRPILRVAGADPPTFAAVCDAEAVTRREWTQGDTLALHILWLAESMPGYGGFQIRPSSFAVLEADYHSAPEHLCALVHEAGHILGLVSNGVPAGSPHVAPDHIHCTTPGCAMQPVLGTASGYCDACLADLRAAGGR
jgi:hypothetical protein